jgi:hypothetical protein
MNFVWLYSTTFTMMESGSTMLPATTPSQLFVKPRFKTNEIIHEEKFVFFVIQFMATGN